MDGYKTQMIFFKWMDIKNGWTTKNRRMVGGIEKRITGWIETIDVQKKVDG